MRFINHNIVHFTKSSILNCEQSIFTKTGSSRHAVRLREIKGCIHTGKSMKYWKNILRTLYVYACVCACFGTCQVLQETSCRSHVERFERLLSVRSCQDSGAVRMQHRSRYDEDAVWRHGRLQSHGVHSFWDAVAAVKLPRCKARTIPLDEKINCKSDINLRYLPVAYA